jgi:hypothetical protein
VVQALLSPYTNFAETLAMPVTRISELDRALASGDDAPVRTEPVRHSDLPCARLNLRLVAGFAAAVGEVARGPDPPVAALEALLDGWAP